MIVRHLALALALALACLSVGCSSSDSSAGSTPALTGSCKDLSTCCGQLADAAKSGCTTQANQNVESTCKSLLDGYLAAQQCSASGGDAGSGGDGASSGYTCAELKSQCCDSSNMAAANKGDCDAVVTAAIAAACDAAFQMYSQSSSCN